MAKITDYRTESQKRRDAQRERIQCRYDELRADGLTHWRACVIAAQEYGWSPTGVAGNAKRFAELRQQEQQTN